MIKGFNASEVYSIRFEKYLLDVATWWSMVALRKEGSKIGIDFPNGKKSAQKRKFL